MRVDAVVAATAVSGARAPARRCEHVVCFADPDKRAIRINKKSISTGDHDRCLVLDFLALLESREIIFFMGLALFVSNTPNGSCAMEQWFLN